MTLLKYIEKRLDHKVASVERKKAIVYIGKNKPRHFCLSFARQGSPSSGYIRQMYTSWLIEFHQGG